MTVLLQHFPLDLDLLHLHHHLAIPLAFALGLEVEVQSKHTEPLVAKQELDIDTAVAEAQDVEKM
jgi:hypothetical protein